MDYLMTIVALLYAAWRWLFTSWNGTQDVTTSTAISTSNHNTYVNDNLDYLHHERPMQQIIHEDSADISITSTSFADVAPSTGGAAGITITLTTSSGRVEVEASGTFTPPATTHSLEFDIILDGTTRKGGTHGLFACDPGGNARQFYVKALFTGLSNGSHTFKLQARTTGANAGTIHNNAEPIVIMAKEV